MKKREIMAFNKINIVLTTVAFLVGFNGKNLVHASELKLLNAIQTNQTKKALEIIEKKKNPWFFQKKTPLKEFLDRKDSNGNSAVISATRNGNSLILKKLLENDAAVDIQDPSGATALHWAVSNGRLSIAQLLLSFNASLEQQNSAGSTPLITGVLTRRDEMVKYLLQKGANPNAKFFSLNDLPAISLTLKNQQIDLFWALIRAHAEINLEDRHGKTPLHYAVSQRNTEIATWLLLNGAHLGTGRRPSDEDLIWFQETLLNYLSSLVDPALIKSTVASYLSLSKTEGWIGSNFHARFIENIRIERLQNMETQVQQWNDRREFPRCSICRQRNGEIHERNNGPANCACYLCPTCTMTYIHEKMSESGPGSRLITCPGPDCHEEVTTTFLKRRNVTPELLEDFRIYQAKRIFDQSPNWFSCPTLNCPSGASTIGLDCFDCDLCGGSWQLNSIQNNF